MSRHDAITTTRYIPSAHVLRRELQSPTQFSWHLLFGAMLLTIATCAHAVTDTYTSSGTWTAPAGVTSVDVEVWGGGGGGGGGDGTQSDGGGGGGGGAYSRTTTITVVPGTTYTVTVGAGGTAGATNGTGGTGGDSWFINTTTILAKGGTGGSAPVAGGAGAAGTGGSAAAGVGTTRYSGGNGGAGNNSSTGRGGPGGSSAGTAANGTSGPTTWNTCTAAAAPTGGGIGGNGGCNNSENGFAPASGNGGGGGGAAERNTTGGAGAAGLVKITYAGTGPVTYYHDTTNGVNIGFDGVTSVTGVDQTIPPAITASLNPVNTCPVSSARSSNHPVGAYTHSRWYLNSDYAVATNIGANPTGSASLRGGRTSDSVVVSLYDYNPVTGDKVLIGSSPAITLTGGATTTTYTYTISSSLYTVPAAHRLMLEYTFNQSVWNDRARVYCSATASYITVTESPATAPTASEYRMDEAGWNGTSGEVIDTVAGNNGTGNGAVTTAPSAGVGQGICNVGVFDGANDYIAIPTLYDQLKGAFTLSVWLNTTQLGNDIDWQAPGITGVEQNGGQDDIFLGWLDAIGHIGFNVKNDTAFKSSTVVSNGAWHHVAFTRDMTTGVTQIYVDGVLEGTRTQPVGTVGNSFDGIGRITNTGATLPIYFAGKLDEYKVFSSVLSGSAITAGYNNEKAGKNWDGSTRTCPSLLDHVSIDAPTTAMAYSTVPVTITPHSATHGALTGYTIKLSTSSGLGDWSIGGGTGTLTQLTPNNGQATYTFGAGESSVALDFTYQSTGSVSIYVSDPGNVDMLANTPISELSNTITYSQPDFAFTNAACVHNLAFGDPNQTCSVLSWSPQVAGIDVSNVYITALNAGVPTRLHPSQERTRDMAFALSCHNPAANAGVQASFTGDVAGVPTTVTLPLCTANGATPSTWSAATLTASFAGGSPSAGPFTFNYADVGKVELWMRNSAATAQTGASGQFVVAPHHFGISAVTAGPIKAGSDFSAKVTAYNGLATPSATPNFGKENLHLAAPDNVPESVTISFSKCQPTGASSVNGTFSTGTLPAFASGAVTVTTLNWSEVGNGDLSATLSSGSYLLSGLTASGNTSASGTVCKDAGGADIAGTVGNFVPHHFNTYVTAPLTTCPTGQTCPVAGWAYSGQPFTVNVSAANASDAITVNYDGTANTVPNFAKAVTLEAWDAAGSTTTQNPPAASAGTLSNNAIAASAFNKGSTVLGTPATSTYTFATTPTAPTDIYLRAADANATSLRSVANTSIEGGLKIVSGRVKIGNNYGSELLPLTMQATVQFYGGANWLTSNTDNSTSFNSALSTAGGNVVVSNPTGLGGAVSINAPSTAAVAGGIRSFTVDAPGVPGSADFGLNAPSWLLTGSNGAAVDPSIPGRATFGIYKGNDAIIYQRESY